MDALHTVWLHTLHSGSQFPTQVFTSLPEELRYEETEMGMRFVMVQKLDGGRWAELIWEMVMPLNAHLVYTNELKTTKVNQSPFAFRFRSANMWMLLSGRAKLAPGGRADTATSIASATPTTRKPRKAWAKSPTIGSSITSPRMKAC